MVFLFATNTNKHYQHFDETVYQKEALIEFNRICNYGGEVLITGKNDFFQDDDISALDAEIGARAKGHPNFFTNVQELLKNINIFGFEVIYHEFYLRRGDFAVNKKQANICKNFYEYTLKLKKIDDIKVPKDLVPTISNKYSKSYTIFSNRSEK